MPKTRYWGRFKIGGKWSSLWHLITVSDGRGGYRHVSSKEEALGAMLKGTRFNPKEVQITMRKPAKYAGREP